MTTVGEKLEEFLANFCAFHSLYLSGCVVGLYYRLVLSAYCWRKAGFSLLNQLRAKDRKYNA